MHDYTGCECPVCHQAFTQTDDIVVCPECGTPYHRACYEKTGHCVFEDKHGTDFVWSNPKESSEGAKSASDGEPGSVVHCPKCGALNPATGLFCDRCGTPLQSSQQEKTNSTQRQTAEDPFFQMSMGIPTPFQVKINEKIQGTIDNIDARNWRAFLGNNAAYYLLNFKAMRLTGRKLVTCFSAFFFGAFYFFYRKMWSIAFALFGVQALLRIPAIMQIMIVAEHPLAAGWNPLLVDQAALVCSFFSFVLMFGQGLGALWAYRRFARRKIQKILDMTPPGENPEPALRQAGGTSPLALGISLGVTFALLMAVSYFCVGHLLSTGIYL